MTGAERGGDRSLGGDIHHIRSAAALEALALGHPEVDVEHLLLGLLAAGGPSARVLTGAGAGLGALRRAVGEVQEQDLRGLGVTAAPPRRPGVRAASRAAALALPVNGRARELMDAAPCRGDDRGLLLALLDDEGRRARRLLGHLGVDAAGVRDRAARDRPPVAASPGGEPDRPGAALLGPAPAGTTWTGASYAQVLPVPPGRVWALISDPSRRPEWDATCAAVSVAADGVERLTRPGGQVVTQAVVHRVPGRGITWRRPARDADAPQVLQVTLTPSGEGTLVRLRRDWAGRGPLWRLARPVLARMVRTQLRAQVHGIAQATA